MHVHSSKVEDGDCGTTGSHFNLEKTTHGAPTADIRLVIYNGISWDFTGCVTCVPLFIFFNDLYQVCFPNRENNKQMFIIHQNFDQLDHF